MPVAEIAGCRMRYEIRGPVDAPVLVLSNSLGTDLGLWDLQIGELITRHRVLRYDTRGHGRSSVTPGPYTLQRLARDVVDLLDALSIVRVDFCGLSLGGMIGLSLACDFPGRLRRLVVSDSAAQIGTQAGWNERIAAVNSGGMAAITASVLGRWFTDQFRARAPGQVQRIASQLAATPADGYAACCAAIRDADLRGAVPAIRVPTLVVVGRDDPAIPPSAGQWLAATIPGAQYCELPTAHLSNVEDPVAFTSALTRFLAA